MMFFLYFCFLCLTHNTQGDLINYYSECLKDLDKRYTQLRHLHFDTNQDIEKYLRLALMVGVVLVLTNSLCNSFKTISM